MSSLNPDQILANIDAVVPPQGGPPKVEGPALNGVLHDLFDLATTPPTTYEEVIHFPGQALFQDTIFETSYLLSAQASAGITLLEVAVGDPLTAAFVPVATGAPLRPSLPLPVGPLTYRVSFAPGVTYGAIKQLIQIQ
ncbi:hypothetical protein GCM10027422_43420 [Hymenobacter arcticus]